MNQKKNEAPMAGDGLLDILGGPAGVTPAATEAAPMVAFEKPHGNGGRLMMVHEWLIQCGAP